MPSIEIIINPGAGADDKREIAQTLTALFGPSAHIILTENGEDLSEIVRRSLSDGAKTIVAGGGDGTISAVAPAIAGGGNRLGVLPLGTLNHFAKDLSIPLDLKEAAKVILAGRTKPVDAAEVNGRVFINNSSLGLYPEVVRGRELHERLGHGKWSSLLRSAIRVFRRYPVFVVRIDADGEKIVTRASGCKFAICSAANAFHGKIFAVAIARLPF